MNGAPMGASILFSIRIGPHRVDDMRTTVDPAYLRLHDGFISTWLSLGYRPAEIIRPEIYPASADLRSLFGRERPVHVILKGPEEIRVLKGAYNIGCPLLDEPHLRCSVSENRPFSNHLRMLKLLDEVWVGSTCASDILIEAGLANVHVVPCPFSAEADRPVPSGVTTADVAWFAKGQPTMPTFGATIPPRGTGGPVCFASSFGSPTGPSEADTLIDAFLALDAVPALLLLVPGDDRTFHRLRGCVVERQIAAAQKGNATSSGVVGLVSPRASVRERAAIYAVSAYYLCASRFAGENGPMLEAMLQGCVPVTVRHSAIGELVAADHPLLIATIEGAGGLKQADGVSCTRAMALAASLPTPVRVDLAARARCSALDHASPLRLNERLQALLPDNHV